MTRNRKRAALALVMNEFATTTRQVEAQAEHARRLLANETDAGQREIHEASIALGKQYADALDVLHEVYRGFGGHTALPIYTDESTAYQDAEETRGVLPIAEVE